RFDGNLDDVFELQDRVAIAVAAVIEPTLQLAETRRKSHEMTRNLSAYDLYLRALPLLFRLSEKSLVEATDVLERAIELDPNFGQALAFASVCLMRLAVDGWTSTAETREKAVNFAHRAIEVSGNDPAVLANAAYTLQSFGENLSTMTALVDRALALNPSY